MQVRQGDLAGARASYQESLDIRRTLATAYPSSAQKQRDLSLTLERIGSVQVRPETRSGRRPARPTATASIYGAPWPRPTQTRRWSEYLLWQHSGEDRRRASPAGRSIAAARASYQGRPRFTAAHAHGQGRTPFCGRTSACSASA